MVLRYLFVLLAIPADFALAWNCQEITRNSQNGVVNRQFTERRGFLEAIPSLAFAVVFQNNQPAFADGEAEAGISEPPLASLNGDAKKLFNEGRVFESQGNMAAAQRLYSKVSKIEPR